MAAGTNIWDGSTDTVIGTDTNWSKAVEAGDDLIFPANATVNVTGTLAEAVNSAVVEDGCTITFGTNVSGVITPVVLNLTGYADNTVELSGTGVTYLKLTNAASVTVKKAGTAQTSGVNPLNIACSNTIETLNIQPSNAAKIGIAALGGEAADFTTINATAGTTYLGSGVTAPTTINQFGGTIHSHTSVATLVQNSGTYYQKTGGITTIATIYGTLYHETTTTMPTLALHGTADFTGGNGTLTIGTACTLYEDCTFTDTYERVAVSNGFVYPAGVGYGDVTVDIGNGFTLTKS